MEIGLTIVGIVIVGAYIYNKTKYWPGGDIYKKRTGGKK